MSRGSSGTAVASATPGVSPVSSGRPGRTRPSPARLPAREGSPAAEGAATADGVGEAARADGAARGEEADRDDGADPGGGVDRGDRWDVGRPWADRVGLGVRSAVGPGPVSSSAVPSSS
ncbi:hypothetical protein GCM10017668_35860 [Streptomyces tuirus]|uniref:Uncharacterized protein n=1 Tax=Streptomyces tuirus TaxID=68278 RepID=A0A7G1NF48_9ACTN|nr:hypothetical protein GCM10017668_35860 [Streptomyces tuirus]